MGTYPCSLPNKESMRYITEEHRANLDKLAAYLESLPEDYDRLKMAQFVTIDHSWAAYSYSPQFGAERFKTDCTTCACALGHGPAAGLPVDDYDRDWNDYSSRVFGVHPAHIIGRYMFDANWPDDHFAAAARIREVLAL